MSIIIDPEFQSLIPPLSTDEYTQLEKNIVKDGIRDALIVWPQGDGNDILIDGHNRFNISVAHAGIRFEIKRMSFKDRDEAKRWIILNQFGRRNLSAYDRSVLALKLKPMIAEKAKEKETERKTTYQKSEKSNLPKVDTTKELAKVAGVSHDTIHKVETIDNSDNEEIKQAVRSGEISINQGYRQIKASEIPPHKTVRQKQNEELHEARERHAEFREKKADNVISIQDIQQDREDRKTIAENLYNDLLSVTTKTYWLGAMNTSADFDALADIVPEDSKKSLVDRVRKMMTVLEKVLEVLNES